MYELTEPDRITGPSPSNGGPSQADKGPYQASTEPSEANARFSQADRVPFGPKEGPIRLTEDHLARAPQIDKGLSQTDKGLTQVISSQI